MNIGLLGPLSVDDGEAHRLGPRDRVVLEVLAVRPGEAVSAEQLADALWGETPPASWAKVVQGCVVRLRRAMGASTIETTPGGYRLAVDGDALDTHRFEQLLHRGRDQAATGSPHRAVETLREALALWRGSPFADVEDWDPGRHEAARLTELRRVAEEELLAARLDAGEDPEVAADAVALVADEPWRERRWAVLALAEYRSGRQADALASIRRARTRLGSQLGIDPGSELVTLERAILQQDPDLAADDEVDHASAECPYKGLAPYAIDDADSFFGREAEIDECLTRLETTPLLVLAGPSGCGKSSLLRAGLMPALARRSRVALVMPGADPQAATTAALASEPGDPILAIDQFEEAFLLGADDDAMRQWMAELTEYATTRAPVVITIRADHLAGLSAGPAFARLAERGLHLVGPLSPDALRTVIERPAQLAGLRIETGLVDLMLRDAEGEPGSLPLLSHALAETWRHRVGRVLTVDGYLATGGIRGAVARSAERLYESLPVDQRPTLRWTLLRLVTAASEGEPVRIRVPTSTLDDDPEHLRLVDLLVRARLVTADESTVELAHESLARAWPRLRSWLDEDAAGQRIWRHLTAAADGWDALGRPPGELYRGARLEAALEWAATDDSAVTAREREFLEASEALAASERQQLAARAREQARQNRRLRGLLAGTAAVLVVALIAGFVAADQRDSARAAKEVAAHEALVSRSITVASTKRDVAALLAVEAFRAQPDAAAESALLNAFTEAPGFMGYTTVSYYVVQGDAVPGSRNAIMVSGTRIHVLDLTTGALGPRFHTPIHSDKSLMSVVRVSGDGRRVAQLMFRPGHLDSCGDYDLLLRNNGRGCTVLTVFDIATRRPVFGPVVTPFQGGDLAINHTGSLVAVAGGFDGDLATYDVDRGRLLGRLAGIPRPEYAGTVRDTGSVVFDDHGRVFVGSLSRSVRLVDARSLEVRRSFEVPPMTTHNNLRLTHSGILLGNGDNGLIALDARTGRQRWFVDLTADPDDYPCWSFELAEKMGTFYCGSQNGEIEERALGTGQLTGQQLDSQRGEVGDLVVSHGDELVEFSRGYYYRWRLDGTGPIATLVAPGSMTTTGYDPSGRYLQLSPRGALGPQDVLDIRDRRRVMQVDRDAYATWVGDRALFVDDRPLFPEEPHANLLADPASGRTWRPASAQVRRADFVFAGVDGQHAWAAIHQRGQQYELDEFELPDGHLTGRHFSVPGIPYVVQSTPGNESVWVNYYRDEGSWLAWEDELLDRKGALFDLSSGGPGREVLIQKSALGDGGRLVGADYVGEIQEYDLATLQPVATLPGSRGAVQWMTFSADGSRLLTTGEDGQVQLYDTAGWIRLGSIPSSAVLGLQEGFLRPDGRAIVVNERSGVVEWNLDDEAMAAAACQLAGRNLTRSEWATYFGDEPYHQTCPQYPIGS